MAGERRDLPCRLKLLDQLKYLEVKKKWSNWETGVDKQIFVVSTRDPSLMKRKLSTLHLWSVGSSWRKKITWLQWCCMDELSLGDRVGSERSKWTESLLLCIVWMSWMYSMHIWSGCVPRELFQSDPGGRTAEPGQTRKFTCFILLLNSTFN